MLDSSALQYWHAELNRMFFGGQLEPVIIRTIRGTAFSDEEATAEFIENTDPFLICFYENDYDNAYSSDMYTLTVLLHEMCHQYVRENDLEDNDMHGDVFKQVALDHGMKVNGYALSEEAQERIEARLSAFKVLSKVGNKQT